jgi:hypothetical protein
MMQSQLGFGAHSNQRIHIISIYMLRLIFTSSAVWLSAVAGWEGLIALSKYQRRERERSPGTDRKTGAGPRRHTPPFLRGRMPIADKVDMLGRLNGSSGANLIHSRLRW